MILNSLLAASLCAFAMSVGQLLFKWSAEEYNLAKGVLTTKSIVIFFFAIGIYCVTTVGWVVLLQKTHIGRIYPVMAMAFVLVPFGSYLFFNEKFNTQYFVGIVCIIVGIVVSIKS